MKTIGFGGSCHWCTEAIFQSLKGVSVVEQGWIASAEPDDAFSEAVVVHFDPDIISLQTLISIHLYTHSCTATHSMRGKYRSAVYTTSPDQAIEAAGIIKNIRAEFDAPIITEVLQLLNFKLNTSNYLDYYYSNPDKPFCQNIINPKLSILLKKFANSVDAGKLLLK